MPRHSTTRQVTVRVRPWPGAFPLCRAAPRSRRRSCERPSSAAWLPVRAAERRRQVPPAPEFTRSEHNGRRHPAETLQLVDRHLAVVQSIVDHNGLSWRKRPWATRCTASSLAHRNSDSSDRCVLAASSCAPMAGCTSAGLAVGFGRGRGPATTALNAAASAFAMRRRSRQEPTARW